MLVNDTAHIQNLCETIRAHWREKGFPAVKVWQETIVAPINRNATAIVVIRSNIGPDGYPPKASK